MKTIICALFIGFFGFAQETEFKFTKDGFTDYVVTEVAGKTQQELFKKAIDWVSVTYKNPKEVIKAQIDNDYIRVEGYKEGIMAGSFGMKFPITYTIEISFKDGKYKFDLTSIKYFAGPPATGYYKEYDIVDTSKHYKKSGEVRAIYKEDHENFSKHFNDLNKNLEAFLKSDTIPSKNDKW